MECIKRRIIKIKRIRSTRSQGLLETTCIDICGPWPSPTLSGKKYFIAFIDDFARHGYIYLKVTKQVQLKCLRLANSGKTTWKKIKVVRSDLGVLINNKYDETGQHTSANYLQECGTVAQYTMFYAP